ncbi:MAG TPA: thioredoxin family protein [Planctomycetaceae bacterium]|nr:thioredoxin family protein [Planctomycetaceae bacterium]
MVRTASTMLPLGTSAPDFTLPDYDGNPKSLADCRGENGTLVIFMCNHCPYVKHVAPELAKLADDYVARGLATVGISSNDAEAYPDDSPAKMKEEAAIQGYHFPYLFDETQEVAAAYHAACTPDFYLFDADLKLVYRGQLDDTRPKQDQTPDGRDLRAAIDALLSGQKIAEVQKPSIGCNIKWKAGAEPGYFNPSGSA